jgi:hypothetical protein
MWSGRQTLSTIEQTISGLHGEESRLDTALRSAIGEAERLGRERAGALKELARVKLDEMTAGRLVKDLDAGERRAAEILKDHSLRLANLAEQRKALVDEVASAEAARNRAAEAVETALAAVEALRADVEGKVKATAEWKSAKAALDAADAVASEAGKKAAQSQADLGAKRRPYDDDPLFLYLWQRGYGTSRYAAGNVARMLDGVVADFIGFIEVRPNYAMLIEIPLRLKEHADAKAKTAAEQREILGDIERRAMLAAGVEAKEQALAEARYKLAAADDAAQSKRALLAAADKQRADLVGAGTSPAYEQALSTIASADSRDDIVTLLREARRTQTPADEALVRHIEQIDASAARAGEDVASLRKTAADLARRRLEIEGVRDRFRNAGYDHPHAGFGNERDIAEVLGRIAEGVIRSGVLWDLLRRNYTTRRPRSEPEFGFPGFPFPFPLPGGGEGPRGGDWREPRSRGGWSPTFDPPGSGGGGGSSDSGGDNFTTEGSF